MMITLFVESIIDIKTNKVYIVFNLFILITGLLNGVNINTYLHTLIVPFILLLFNVKEEKIGYGDIETICVISMFYNIYQLSIILLLASVINLLFAVMIKKDKYPFIPFIFISVLINTIMMKMC